MPRSRVGDGPESSPPGCRLMSQRASLNRVILGICSYLLPIGVVTAIVSALIFVLQPFGLRWPVVLGVVAALCAVELPCWAGRGATLATRSIVRGPARSSLALARRSFSA